MAFLTDDDFENLPEDDRDAFARLEALSRRRLFESAQHTRDQEIGRAETMGYMSEISAIASEFGIQEIAFDHHADDYFAEFHRFTLKVQYAVAQIRVQRSRRLRANSVALRTPARLKIQRLIERIKSEVTVSDLPSRRRERLLNKISEFEAELSRPRVDLAKAMAIVALVLTTVHEAEGILIDSPEAVATISHILGSEKEAEDEIAAARLGAPEKLKALPDMRSSSPPVPKKTPPPMLSFDQDLDDDVPF